MTIQHAAEMGDTVYDLGAGAESYKYQFTRDEAMFESSLLVRRGLRPFHSPVQLLPYRARQRLARVLGSGWEGAAVPLTGSAQWEPPLDAPPARGIGRHRDTTSVAAAVMGSFGSTRRAARRSPRRSDAFTDGQMGDDVA